jgi:adenine-specific DNA-methyltransferase
VTSLYPRDSSLDPQLVWKGKDEQDRQPLEIPTIPIYIQEKIHPQALIEDLHRQAQGDRSQQADLFGALEKVEPSKRLEFYRHDQHWTNRLILGDSLLVMTSLAEKERLRGQVQMIYMDPPYGIKFGSNWQVSTRKRDLKDTRVEDVTRQPEQVKAFRDTWQLGIHSYLSYLRDRLVVAHQLLGDSGSIFVQIGDENTHLVRCLLDEVFGSENFIASIAFKKKKMPLGETYIFTTCDYLLWYGKNRQQTRFRKLFVPRDDTGEGDYGYVELPDSTCLSRASLNGDVPAGARLFQSMDLRSSGRTESCVFAFTHDGKQFFPSEGKSWKTNLEGMKRLAAAGRLFYTGDTLRYKLYFDDYPVQELSHVWMDTQGATDKEYVVQTSTKVVERCLLMTTDPGDLVLDPTCGSGTTAFVAEQWGRRWITIDTSRVALALARTRLMAGRFPYYLLADSPEGRQKEVELTGLPPAGGLARHDVRKGFVYKRVPHVTLGSITNNPDVRETMTREQIAAAVGRHADSEVLYDQPYEDRSIVRVSGPFTVESLSPHRLLPSDPSSPAQPASAGNFVLTILDNLRKAGVQNTRRKERLKFDRLDLCNLEPFQFEGEYTDEAGQVRRVAVCLGPEFGTVGPELVQGAAHRLSCRGAGGSPASGRGAGEPPAPRISNHGSEPYDVLLVCGFAFDPHVAQEANIVETQMGKVKVLLVRMNPDLSMGDELLKKTGSGNLFTIFGEPDLELIPQPDGRWRVRLKGLDVFDPTTGEVRSSSTADVACWFIDTDYDEESFFVRQAYFCGGVEPYEKLQRALKAEIDEDQWRKLYSVESRPFAAPTSGKIAVKVINHYGDEVLKVYSLRSPTRLPHDGTQER